MQEIATSRLVLAAGDLWREAVNPRFLRALADGTLAPTAFQRWLVQDYHFANGLLSFQAVMTSKAPREGHGLLIGGLAALEQELAWFERHAERLGLRLNSPVHPVGRRYVDYLIAAAYVQPFGVQAAILFAVEAAYLAAWSALSPAGPYAEFIARWSNTQFAEYVRRLGALAQHHQHPQQAEHFNQVLKHERDFWEMTWDT